MGEEEGKWESMRFEGLDEIEDKRLEGKES